MAIPIQQHTRNALGDGMLPACESRSLFAARFADPASEKDSRKAWFQAFIARHSSTCFPNAASWLPIHAEVIHARLMSRLMVDLAGGVMENANLNLDRYGLPRIPGSAVKGCARRMALQSLHDWVAFPETQDDPTVACRGGFTSPTEMLAAIARIFGWVESDWSTAKNRDNHYQQEAIWKSDFAWAAGGADSILRDARAMLPTYESFGGTIAFLDASPNRDPGLELDVVTPHHTAYYEGRNPGAPDTEDPVPVYYPAIKPQTNKHHFTFPLIPLARVAQGDVTAAINFLAHGLEIMGLGAKTHAGYGWFETLKGQPATSIQSDYANEEFFRNSVIKLLNQPGKYDLLKKEVEKLKKAENAKWLVDLRKTLRGDEMRDVRRALRKKDWFPQEWLEASKA